MTTKPIVKKPHPTCGERSGNTNRYGEPCGALIARDPRAKVYADGRRKVVWLRTCRFHSNLLHVPSIKEIREKTAAAQALMAEQADAPPGFGSIGELVFNLFSQRQILLVVSKLRSIPGGDVYLKEVVGIDIDDRHRTVTITKPVRLALDKTSSLHPDHDFETVANNYLPTDVIFRD